MPKQQFSADMGAVRIIPRRDGSHHRGVDSATTPKGWTPIKASKYVTGKGSFGKSPTTSLADVVRSGILGPNTVLIIVHMGNNLNIRSRNNGQGIDDSVIEEQIAVIRAAMDKKIPIYVTDRNECRVTKGLTIVDTLLGDLAEAVKGYNNLNYYASFTANALEGRDTHGRLLRGDLLAHGVKEAIVIGQAYGVCVDSTILGVLQTTFTKENKGGTTEYVQGLLDIGIPVTTARAVLNPPEERGSPYFEFNMQPDIELPPPTVSHEPAKPRPNYLQFPDKFPAEAHTKPNV